MNSDSNPVSKCLRTEATTEGEKSSGTDDIAGSVSGGSQVATSEDVANTFNFASVFTEDILPDIFDNPRILTAKDLLQFRLVNRCWRDAATAVLLKRNLCKIPLCLGVLPIEPLFSSEVVARPLKDSLSNLSKLISTSPEFPTTSFGIHYLLCGGPYPTGPDYADAGDDGFYENVLHFLSLHEKIMRELSLSNGISKKALQNLLYVHMCHLITLDIPDFDFDYKNQTHEARQHRMPVCLPPPSTLQIKEIFVGGTGPVDISTDKFNFVKELIRCSPNLTAIRDIRTSLFGDLLEMGKCRLVKDAYFDLLFPTPQFTKLVTGTILKGSLPNAPFLQLSKLTVECMEYRDVSNTNDVTMNGLNLILSASKTSLKHLKLVMNRTDNVVNIYIPPLPHLTFLELVCSETRSTIRFHFGGDVLGQALQAGELTADGSVDDFNKLPRRNQGKINIPADYFPRLREVEVFLRGFLLEVTSS